MPISIKICGLRTPDALDAAVDAGADMVGFVFFPPSPRHVDEATARLLGARVKGRALKVVLSVDADDGMLAASIAAVAPDLLQLHGSETPQRVLAVKSRFRLPVMKAIAVESRGDLARVPDYAEVADRLIFDARAPRDSTRPGGLGTPFDWRLLANLDPRITFMLSGGLTPGNVGEAIAVARPAGVDVSSGVERAPGEKDADLIRAFIRTVRAAPVPRAAAEIAGAK
jgi:phosphoribosylanthranilate isomerase